MFLPLSLIPRFREASPGRVAVACLRLDSESFVKVYEGCERGGNAGTHQFFSVLITACCFSFYFVLFWFLFIAETLETSWGQQRFCLQGAACMHTVCARPAESQSLSLM